MSLSRSAVLALAGILAGVVAASEAPSESSETATFAMYCYWTGEAALGRVPGGNGS